MLRYIRNNPAKASLHPGEYALYESDFAKQYLTPPQAYNEIGAGLS